MSVKEEKTRSVFADGATNSCAQTRTRLTGLSDALRSEVAELRDGAEVSRAVRSYDAASGTERETVSNAVGGVSWTVSRLGHPVETGSPGCVVSNFYAPTGKVYIRQRSVGGGGPVRFEAVMTDALGDEVGRTVCDRYWLDEAPSSHLPYDCRGNRSNAVDALGNETFAAFGPDGNVEHEGGATYPALHAYDTAGRRTAVATTRDGASGDVTQWGYDAATGACTNKTYADGSTVTYAYTPDNLPLRTTYASGRWRENAYNARRELVGVEYSDPSLDFSICRDVFGRATNVADAAGGEWRCEYGTGNTVVREILSGDATGAGTVEGFAFAENGTLTVKNMPKGGGTLPGVYVNCIGLENIGGWALYDADKGRVARGSTIAVSDGEIRIIAPGSILYVR